MVITHPHYHLVTENRAFERVQDTDERLNLAFSRRFLRLQDLFAAPDCVANHFVDQIVHSFFLLAARFERSLEALQDCGSRWRNGASFP